MLKFLGSLSHQERTHLFVPLEGDPARLSAPTAQPVNHLVLEQRGVAKVLVDGVGGHLGDVLRRLGLDIEGDERVCDQVVDRLEPLLPDKVLPIVEQSVVKSLVPEPASRRFGVKRCWRQKQADVQFHGKAG